MSLIEKIELWYRKRRMRLTQGQPFYERFFDDRDWMVISHDIGPYLIRKPIQEHLQNIRNKVIVDVGCGTGAVINSLDLKDNLVCGCDISHDSISRARRLSHSGIHFLQADTLHLPFEESKVNVVLCLDVLEHLENDQAALTEMARVLPEGGELIVRVPYRPYHPDYKEAYGHLRHYMRQALEGLLRESGFAIEQALPMYPRFTTINRYFYAFITALNLLLGKIKGDNKTFYERRLGALAIYKQLCFPLLLGLSHLEAKGNTDNQGSTFLVARKWGKSDAPASEDKT
ncbi:MAG: class I SAM-dependent methyltransferase [Chloroflexi bacterium]|nr:class I SAM-dependent methyltransferase [Chloroflexota bacterium]